MLTPRAQKILNQFGFERLKNGQSEIIQAGLKHKDIFAVQATGSGKSLCFQLPALAQNGLTIVVSPLLALMRDQVSSLKSKGFKAGMYSSVQTEKELEKVRNHALKGQLKLLYLSPEQLAKASVMYWLDNCKINRLVIDEAHCASEWGHDFRPDYQSLGDWIAKRPNVQVSAFTATATMAVKSEFNSLLFQNRKPQHFFSQIIRDDIAISFIKKNKPRAQLLNAVPDSGAVLIYASTRNKCEVLAKAIGQGAEFYHAGLETAERTRIETAFINGEIRIVVATNAFGMGVDKSDIRTVIHADLPPSPESFCQEIGRAGRDALPANALCLFGEDDLEIRTEQIETQTSTQLRRDLDISRLHALYSIAENNGGWNELSDYFAHDQAITNAPQDNTAISTLKRWRHQIAQHKKMPPFMVLPDQILNAIAQKIPQTIDDLAQIKGIGFSRITKYGDQILNALHGHQTPTNNARKKLALSGDGHLHNQLQIIGQELRLGQDGNQRPVELTDLLIRRIIEKRPTQLNHLEQITGLTQKHIDRYGRAVIALFDNFE